ncbi:hypothetical protein AB0J63_41405 [Streptosporangium canum]
MHGTVDRILPIEATARAFSITWCRPRRTQDAAKPTIVLVHCAFADASR